MSQLAVVSNRAVQHDVMMRPLCRLSSATTVLLALLSTPMAVHGGTDAGPARARVRDGVVDADLEIVGDVSFLASPIVNYTIVADGTASQGCEAEVRIFVNEATTDGWNAELSLHPSVAVSTLVGAALDANLDGSDGMLKVYSQDATESVPASTTLEINVFFGGNCPRIFAATFGGDAAIVTGDTTTAPPTAAPTSRSCTEVLPSGCCRTAAGTVGDKFELTETNGEDACRAICVHSAGCFGFEFDNPSRCELHFEPSALYDTDRDATCGSCYRCFTEAPTTATPTGYPTAPTAAPTLSPTVSPTSSPSFAHCFNLQPSTADDDCSVGFETNRAAACRRCVDETGESAFGDRCAMECCLQCPLPTPPPSGAPTPFPFSRLNALIIPNGTVINATDFTNSAAEAQDSLAQTVGTADPDATQRISSGGTRTTVDLMDSYLSGMETAAAGAADAATARSTVDAFVEMVTNFTGVFVANGVDQTELDEPLIRAIDTSLIGATRQLLRINAPTRRVYSSARSRVQIEVAEAGQEIRFTEGVASTFRITAGSVATDNASSFFGATITEYTNPSIFVDGLNSTTEQIGSTVLSVLVTTQMNGTVIGVFDFSLNLHGSLLGNANLRPECVWYVEPNNGSEAGEWSTAGCITRPINRTHAVCECTHLTSFAVLVSGDGAQSASQSRSPHAQVLSIVTYLGVGFSLAGIVVTVVTVLAVRPLRTQLRYQILLDLVAALGLALLCFCLLTTPTTTHGCEAVSFVTLYFFMASILWNMVEAYDLYRTFCVVFHDGQSRAPHYMRRFRLFAWGGAVISPSLALGLDRSNFITATATDPHALCWINMASPIRWAFLGPIAGVLLINLTIAVKIVGAIRAHVGHKSYRSVMYTAKIVANVSVVTGLTWAFAVLVVLTSEVTFSYLFAIFASTQGATVFYFHVYHNELSMQAWRSWVWSPLSNSSSRKSSASHSRGGRNVVQARRRTNWQPAMASSSSSRTTSSQDDSVSNRGPRPSHAPWLKGPLAAAVSPPPGTIPKPQTPVSEKATASGPLTPRAAWSSGTVTEEVDEDDVITVGTKNPMRNPTPPPRPHRPTGPPARAAPIAAERDADGATWSLHDLREPRRTVRRYEDDDRENDDLYDYADPTPDDGPAYERASESRAPNQRRSLDRRATRFAPDDSPYGVPQNYRGEEFPEPAYCEATGGGWVQIEGGPAGQAGTDSVGSTLTAVRFDEAAVLNGRTRGDPSSSWGRNGTVSTLRFDGVDSTVSSLATLRFGDNSLSYPGQFAPDSRAGTGASKAGLGRSGSRRGSVGADEIEGMLIIQDGLFLFPSAHGPRKRRRSKAMEIAIAF
eukprot:m.20726 g.20726  ORF g.20726 m.20726 type:complete len:1336 (+) comp5604_c0_seq1:293-4300(+)